LSPGILAMLLTVSVLAGNNIAAVNDGAMQVGKNKVEPRRGPPHLTLSTARRKGIKPPRYGAVGKHGSLAVIERLILTLKVLLRWTIDLRGLWCAPRLLRKSEREDSSTISRHSDVHFGSYFVLIIATAPVCCKAQKSLVEHTRGLVAGPRFDSCLRQHRRLELLPLFRQRIAGELFR